MHLKLRFWDIQQLFNYVSRNLPSNIVTIKFFKIREKLYKILCKILNSKYRKIRILKKRKEKSNIFQKTITIIIIRKTLRHNKEVVRQKQKT